MLNLNSFMIGTMQVKILAEFYEKAFDRPADMVEQGWHGWLVGKCFLTIGEHSEVNGQAKEPQRVIFNFETNDVKGEFERLKALGARVVKEPYDMQGGMWIATLADPDGNYFQLMTPWKADK